MEKRQALGEPSGASRVSCPGGKVPSSLVTRGMPLPGTASGRIRSNGHSDRGDADEHDRSSRLPEVPVGPAHPGSMGRPDSEVQEMRRARSVQTATGRRYARERYRGVRAARSNRPEPECIRFRSARTGGGWSLPRPRAPRTSRAGTSPAGRLCRCSTPPTSARIFLSGTARLFLPAAARLSVSCPARLCAARICLSGSARIRSPSRLCLSDSARRDGSSCACCCDDARIGRWSAGFPSPRHRWRCRRRSTRSLKRRRTRPRQQAVGAIETVGAGASRLQWCSAC